MVEHLIDYLIKHTAQPVAVCSVYFHLKISCLSLRFQSKSKNCVILTANKESYPIVLLLTSYKFLI